MPRSAFPASPRELSALSLPELTLLAEEIRQEIVSTSLKNGGHLGASLGAVELAIALHRVFESPREPIVWDVGHQAYAHKLLTGRAPRFSTLRLKGGLSGFLSRAESEHDAFGAGHSSTSLSAALAMAWARGQESESHPSWTVAVIGDGGLTAGLALEALNNVRATPIGPLLIVVNDNQMSISPNVGAIPSILAGGGAREFFSQFGIDYVGPVDGHDLATLIGTLEGAKRSYAGRPIALHALTQKGKGYAPAEEHPAAYHGVSPIQSKVPGKAGASARDAKPSRSWSEAFGAELVSLAERDPKIVAITAAMAEGTGLQAFAQRFPDRFFDVGIAEPHAVTFAAGLATQGYRPVVAIYSTFLQRALDSVIHDVCLQGLGVTFAIDRAGLVGADGPTHHGAFDLAYLAPVPGITLHSPWALDELGPALASAVASGAPAALRFPRGPAPERIEGRRDGSVLWIQEPKDPELVVVALGAAATRAREALRLAGERGKKAALVAAGRSKPLPEKLESYLRSRPASPLVVVEDGARRGGFGEELVAALSPRSAPHALLGYPDRFIPHGSVAELEEEAGVSAPALAEAIGRFLK